ncbi:MAG: excisionase family DNA-binding protein [Rubrobacteraceae bacterium]
MSDLRKKGMVPDMGAARELDEMLSGVRGEVVLRDASGREFPLPRSVRGILEKAVREMASGKSVRVLAVESEISTQQAADLLNVSRPHLVKLLERGEIPCRKVGSHRRVVLEDLAAYKEKRDRDRIGALDEITRVSDDLGLYDE